MKELISCKYHEDSQTVELLYTDRTLIDIDCMAVEDTVERNTCGKLELDYLLTQDILNTQQTSLKQTLVRKVILS